SRLSTLPLHDALPIYGGPHLLAVDDPAVAVAFGPGLQGGHVAARAGLGEELAPDLLAAQQRPDEPLALGVGAPVHDRGAGHAQADGEDVGGQGEVAGRGVERALLLLGQALAAPPLGPGDAGVSGVVETGHEVLGHGDRVAAGLLARGDVPLQPLPGGALVVRKVHIHSLASVGTYSNHAPPGRTEQ